MRLALVPIRAAVGGPRGAVEPALPEILRGRWGQASSMWGASGQMLIWLDVDDTEALALVRDTALGVIGDRVRWDRADRAEMLRPHARQQALVDAFAAAPKFAGDSRRLLALRKAHELRRSMESQSLRRVPEMVAAYRERAEVVERQWFTRPDGITGLMVQASDGFSGTTGASADGRVMDAAGGGAADTWAVTSGTWTIDTNRLKDTGGAFSIIRDSSMSAVGRLRVTATKDTGRAIGPALRVSGASNNHCYSGWENHGDILSHTPGFTYLATGAHAPWVAGEIQTLDGDGSSISALRNGSLCAGPVTDTAIATGRAGVMSGGSGHVIDDWSAEIDAPTFTGSAAVEAAAATCAGAGTATAPTFTGSGAVVAAEAILSGAGTSAAPEFTAGAALLCVAATVAGSGAASPPIYTASGSLVAAEALAAATGEALAGAVAPTGLLCVTEGLALRVEEGFALNAAEGFALRAGER